jgi:hypothetical protein
MMLILAHSIQNLSVLFETIFCNDILSDGVGWPLKRASREVPDERQSLEEL